MVSTSASKDTPRAAAAFLHAMRVLSKEINRELPINVAMVFLRVAQAGDDGIKQDELTAEFEMNTATASRTVQMLSDMHYLKDRPGLQLIQRTQMVLDNRRNLLKLTSKGEALMNKISDEMAKRWK